MTIYVDNMRSQKIVCGYSGWSHLFNIPVDEGELDRFALSIGLKTRWKQKAGTLDVHYDVIESKRKLAIKKGAIPVGIFEGARLRREYKIAKTLADEILDRQESRILGINE